VNRTRTSDDGFDPCLSADEKKQAALRYIMEAWDEAVFDGIEPELLANAAFFAAISERFEYLGAQITLLALAGIGLLIGIGIAGAQPITAG